MTLKEALIKLLSEGFTHARDEYCFRGRKLQNYIKSNDIIKDKDDWEVSYDDHSSRRAFITQTNEKDSWSFSVWKAAAPSL